MTKKSLKKSSRKEAPNRNSIRRLQLLAAGLLACNLILWRCVIVNNVLPIPNASAATQIAATAVKNNSVPTASVKAAAVGLPVRLRIAAIGVDAAIEPVGLGSDGAMGTPRIPSDTAWYMPGPKPGETGSAVIAGHVNWWNGASSAFAKLSKIKPGDMITVQNDLGAIVTFKVNHLEQYAVAADPTNVFISNDGKAHLNLVTCIGIWNKRMQQYSQRLVVFADKTE
jgi:LPXTG-site transpeptidase (sortase) family protein